MRMARCILHNIERRCGDDADMTTDIRMLAGVGIPALGRGWLARCTDGESIAVIVSVKGTSAFKLWKEMEPWVLNV